MRKMPWRGEKRDLSSKIRGNTDLKFSLSRPQLKRRKAALSRSISAKYSRLQVLSKIPVIDQDSLGKLKSKREAQKRKKN